MLSLTLPGGNLHKNVEEQRDLICQVEDITLPINYHRHVTQHLMSNHIPITSTTIIFLHHPRTIINIHRTRHPLYRPSFIRENQQKLLLPPNPHPLILKLSHRTLSESIVAEEVERRAIIIIIIKNH